MPFCQLLRNAAAAAMLLALLAGLPCAAQRIVLPHATGALTPAAEWTVLRIAELENAARDDDPTGEPAHTMLLATIAELRAAGRLREHALFHAPGTADGTLRIVNAWSEDGGATGAELLRDDRVEAVRLALEPELRGGGTEVRYLGHEKAGLFPVGALILRFELRRDDRTWFLRHHLVPAGDRLQYFDALWCAGDDGATAEHAIDALLATYDGAREQSGDPVLRNMLLGGLAGAFAGIAAALLRRRRLQRLLAAQRADDHTDHGTDADPDAATGGPPAPR